MKEIERVIFILLWIICTACNSGKPSAEFDRLEQLMPHHPDSVLQALESMDTLHLSERERAYYYLLQTEAEDKCYVEHTTDSLISWAADYFRRKDDRAHYAKALYLQGRVYQDFGKILHAQDCYRQALKYNITTDYALSGRICNHLGLLYLYHNLYRQSIDCQKEAIHYFHLDQDTLGQIYALRDCARAFDITQQTDSAEQYYVQAINLMSHHTVPSVLTELGSIYLGKKDYDLAFTWINRAISETKSQKSKYTIYYVLGSLYTEIGQVDSAYFYLRQCAESAPLLATRSGAYLGLAQIAASRSQWKEATEAYHQYVIRRDSVEEQKRTDELHKSNQLYVESELLQSNLEAMELDKQNMIMCTIVIVLLLFCLISTIYYMYRKRTYQFILDMNLQQIAKNELIIRSLQSTQAYETIHREEMSTLIEALKNENDRLKNSDSAISKKEEQLLQLFRNPVGWNPDKEQWTKLIQIVDQRHPLFSMKLHDQLPRLSEKELRLCYLLKAKVKLSNIALLFDNTLTNVSMLRKRLYESMTGQKGTAKQFDDFIEKI